MAIVIRNDKPRGRLFRYRVDGVPKSIWIDGYSEVVIPELSDSSAMLHKVSKAKEERIEKLSNTSTLSRDLFVSRAKLFKEVTDEIRWKPEVVRLETGFNTHVFSKEGVKYVFATSPNEILEVGTTIRGSKLNLLSSQYNGVYQYAGFNYTIRSSRITEINSISDGDNEIPVSSEMITLYSQLGISSSVYYNSEINPLATGAQFYTDSDLTTIWDTTAVYKYDVQNSFVNRNLTLAKGRVTSVSNYTNGGLKIVNLSGATATTLNVYVLSTQTIDQPSVDWFSDTELLTPHNITGVYLDLKSTPKKYIQVLNGRVVSSDSIFSDSETITYTSWTVTDSKANNLTIYTQQDNLLTNVGVVVYTKNDGTGTPEDGTYQYNDGGTLKNIVINRGTVQSVTNAQRR